MRTLGTLKAGSFAVCLLMAAGSGAAWAHGSGGTGGGIGGLSHAGTALSAPASRISAPMSSTAKGMSSAQPGAATTKPRTPTNQTGGNPGGTTGSSFGDVDTTAQAANVMTACEQGVPGNCEATAESRSTVSGGDPNPIFTPPVATTIPPTPATPAITEPTTNTGPILEQSGGSSGVVTTAGGGPSLADCMALWEPAVHMTKTLWKDVCVRTLNGIEEPQVALGSVDPTAAPHRVTTKTRHNAAHESVHAEAN
jgi:hypothetical protein